LRPVGEAGAVAAQGKKSGRLSTWTRRQLIDGIRWRGTSGCAVAGCSRRLRLLASGVSATSASATVSSSTARSCSSPTSPCTATAPVRGYLPHLIDLILRGEINPGKVFDLELPLGQAADAYRALDERRAIKVLLRP
jgi:threonine dehydrogenase-like Zn-dependent dehydrogenase